jgi:diketogulonate reductase-like aldo/keto reductase
LTFFDADRSSSWRKRGENLPFSNQETDSGAAATATTPKILPKQPAPASKTEKSVSLGAGRKRLPLCGLRLGGGGAEGDVSSPLSLPLNVVVDAEDAGSVAAAAAALRGLSEQQREDELFLTLILDAASVEAAARGADHALAALGRSTADLVLLDWSNVVDLERGQPAELRVAGREAWTAAAKDLLGSGSAGGGRRRARLLGLANAGLADVEGLLALAEETAAAASPAPRPAALAVELHPLLPQRKLVGVCRRKGVATLALNPAGNGGDGAGAGCCSRTRALLESAAVAAAAAAEGRSPREVRSRLILFGFVWFLGPLGAHADIARASQAEEERGRKRDTNERASERRRRCTQRQK